MNLNNPAPYPSTARRCFWDAEYIASQPFCITSKLTEEELKALAEFEELKFWESLEAMEKSLISLTQDEPVEALEYSKTESIKESLNRGLLDFDQFLLSDEYQEFCEEKGLDSITSKLTEELFTKHTKKRSDFLTR